MRFLDDFLIHNRNRACSLFQLSKEGFHTMVSQPQVSAAASEFPSPRAQRGA